MTDTIPTLEQFIEPTPIPFTFGAPGWHVAAAALLVCLLVALALWFVHYRRNRYRRYYCKKIKSKEAELVSISKYDDLVYTANMLMKQICVRLYTRKAASALRGKEWLDFLNQHADKDIFSEADEKILTDLYQNPIGLGKQEALAFSGKAKYWIMKHKHVARRSK